MNALRTIAFVFVALSMLAWLPSSHAQCPNQPGPLAATYASEASTHPQDNAIGVGRRVHAYVFTVPAAVKLCSIGYEAPPVPPASYTFRLYDCNFGIVPIPGAVITVPATAFTGGGTQYVSVNPAWPLLAGNCYQIRRRVNGPATAAQMQGRRLANETVYPINTGAPITIVNTSFFNTAGGNSIFDTYLPYIDFGTR